MVSKSQLTKIVESAIDGLVTAFNSTPYAFYTENDLHCYLYAEILDTMPVEQWLCKTADGKNSILLHKEYPTKERYNRKALEEGLEKGARGHFDISIWNPENTQERVFRVNRSTDFKKEQHTFIVVEFDLSEGNASLDDSLHHLKWDRMKLKGEKNEIENGYLLVFGRDWNYTTKFLEYAKREVSQEDKVVILYIENTDGKTRVGTLSKKRFLDYNSLL